MARKRTTAKIDRELIDQLNEAEASHQPVTAVVSLKIGRGKSILSPDQVGETVEALVHRVEKETGAKPTDLNVFRSMGSFVIEAEPSFIRKLIEHEEINSAVANQRGATRKVAVVKRRKGAG